MGVSYCLKLLKWKLPWKKVRTSSSCLCVGSAVGHAQSAMCTLHLHCVFDTRFQSKPPSHPLWFGLEGTPSLCFKALGYFKLEFYSSIHLFFKMCKMANSAIAFVSGAIVLWLSTQLKWVDLEWRSSSGQPFLTKWHHNHQL